MGILAFSSVSANDLNDDVVAAENDFEEKLVFNDFETDQGSSSQDCELGTDYHPKNSTEIQDYVDNAENGDVIVLNGTYLLQSTITVNKSLTFLGINDATVDGSSSIRLFTVNNSSIVFKNIIFKNGHADEGGAIYGNCTAVNCTFLNNNAYGSGNPYYNPSTGQTTLSQGYGGAMKYGSAVNCTFINNTAVTSGGAIYCGDALNCTFINNTAGFGGGALYCGDAEDSTFKNNSAGSDGGAIYDGNAVNCTFYNNSARRFGGAVYSGDAVKCNFVNNSVYGGYEYISGGIAFRAYGGAIYEGIAENCSFSNNFANLSGGAIYRGSASNCIFMNNSAQDGGALYAGNALNSVFIGNNATNGGAIFVESSGYSLDNCTFKSNHACNGGAIYYTYDINRLQNHVFDNNSASGHGNDVFINASNVYNPSDWTLTLIKCTFSNCRSSDEAWFVEFTGRKNSNNNHLSISQCRFINCSSDGNGGAIFLVNVKSCTVNDCYFEGNSAIRGGAVYWDETISSLSNCRFKNNHAQYGGALFCQNIEGITDCSFENNSALNSGNDVFFNESCEVNLLGCNFTSCVSDDEWFIGFNNADAFSFMNCNFIDCFSKFSGGAINLSNINSCDIINCYFEGNNARADKSILHYEEIFRGGAIYLESIATSLISNCTFIGNDAGYGGAIYICSTTAYLDNNTFRDNYAYYVMSHGSYGGPGGTGGAIYTENSNIIVNNSDFMHNYISYGGSAGAIFGNASIFNSAFIENSVMGAAGAIAYAHAENCIFINNSASNSNGGAIYLGSALNCSFTGNSASNGGALGESAAINCTFENNHASYNGGAMYSGNAVNCSFVGNTANNNGGAYSNNVNNQFDIIGNCTFINNSAENDGGAIFINGGHDFVIENCEFSNCSSDNQGGAIYLIAGSDFDIIQCSFENCNSSNASYLGYDDSTTDFNISDCTFDEDPEGIALIYNPTLNVNDVKIVKGENGVLIANLSDIRGQLSNKTIRFSVNGLTYNCTTDGNGLAFFNFNEYLDEGHYNVTVSFEGDNQVYPISGSAKVFISSYRGILMITQVGSYYDDVVLTLKLINSKTNADIPDANITVEFDNGEYAYLKTDSYGVATYKVPFAPGTYAATAYVADVNVDVNNASLSDLAISNIVGKMIVTQVDNNVLSVKLINQNTGEVYRNINVTLRFEGFDPVYGVTNDQGVFRYTMDFDYGTYNVVVSVSKPYTSIEAVYLDNIVISEDNSHAKVSFANDELLFEYGTSGSIYFTVEGGIVEPANIKVLNHPEAKISLVKNEITISNLNPGKYVLFVSATPFAEYKEGNGTVPITVNKATASIKVSKVTVAYKKYSLWTIRLINSKTNKPIANIKLTLKVYTGSKFKKVTVTTNSKGEASYQTKGLSKGTHKVVVSASDSRYNFNTLVSSIKVVKQTALTFKVTKKTFKDGASLSITVKNKKTKKPVNGVKVKLLIYTGSKVTKTIKLKTLKKGRYSGIVGYATNELKVGKHKVKILPIEIKYSGSAKSSMKITKQAKKYPAMSTKISAKI